MIDINRINDNLYAIDNLVNPDYFNELTKACRDYFYKPTNREDMDSVWHFNGEYNPFISQNIVWTPDVKYQQLLNKINGLTVHPTNTVLDELISKIHEIAIMSNICGEVGKDWLGTLSSIYKYDNGKKLIWHTDSNNYSGAFTYYLHDSWQHDWGGYFLHRDNQNNNVPDDGGFLFPAPNRLVLLKSPLLHSVSPITTPQGYSRIAITGFFVKPERVEELLNRFANHHS